MVGPFRSSDSLDYHGDETRIYGTSELIDALLNSRMHASLVPSGQPILFRSTFGVGVSVGVSDYGIEGAIGHRDALLSVLSECGISSRRPVSLEGGEFYCDETLSPTRWRR